MFKYLCMSLCLFFFGLSVQGKTLDIIVDESNNNTDKTFECKEDSDCPSGKYCHQEQKICVPCNVPPYEWTGTTCQCPEGTVEKDGTDCVECLASTDCTTDHYCNTDTNRCEHCTFPKLWVNNRCVCPNGMREEGNICVCIQENTQFDASTGLCVCSLNEDKCIGSHFNEEKCICCPIDKPIYTGGICQTCTALYPDRPIWDDTLKQCVQCQTNTDCSTSLPMCDSSTHTCTACPPEHPKWDATLGQCVACDSSTPFWSDKLKKCVECLTNANCTNTQFPLCNTDEGVCESCPDTLYFDGEKCVPCPYAGETYDKTRGKCIIKLPSTPYSRNYGSNVGRRWMVNYGFGPYETDYEVWVEGYADDALYLDINRTLSYCHWSDNKSCSESDKKDPWKMGDLFDFSGGYIANTVYNPNGLAKMGTLKKGNFGAVHIGSNTGWLEWKATTQGKGPRIWLERSVGVK